jgi:hypothetical protein
MSVVRASVTGSPQVVVTVDHWFDVICPLCRIAQDRNRILCEHGAHVVEPPLHVHPEIRSGGNPAGPRAGSPYDFLARQADAAGLAQASGSKPAS